MKKILALFTALSLLMCCAAFAEEEFTYQTGTYLITNTTGGGRDEHYAHRSCYRQLHRLSRV